MIKYFNKKTHHSYWETIQRMNAKFNSKKLCGKREEKYNLVYMTYD